MIFFGHLGIGSKIVSPWTKGLPLSAVFVGTILPDLIDKPIYYGLAAWTGLSGIQMSQLGGVLGLIQGTRDFGHTGIFLLILASIASWRHSKWMAALALGVASHLLLDNLIDAVHDERLRSAMIALVWPMMGWSFAPVPFVKIREHFAALWHNANVISEALGALILLWDGWKYSHRRVLRRAAR